MAIAIGDIRFRNPRLWQRVSTLLWARRAVWVFAPLTLWVLLTRFACVPCVVAGAVFTLILVKALGAWEQSLRRQFVRDAALPRFLVDKLIEAYPQLKAGDAALVLRGLRQFFLAHLRSGRQFVGMPSKLVDTAWHEFILHTRAYENWCTSAFGSLLHHTPAEALGGSSAKRNDGLRRTWYWTCKEESIDPRNPTRLPLLFALDKKFDIAGGFRYEANCNSLNRGAGSNTYCGSDFGGGGDSGTAAGDADGFGGSESTSSGDGGGSDGGGGCGGGGGD